MDAYVILAYATIYWYDRWLHFSRLSFHVISLFRNRKRKRANIPTSLHLTHLELETCCIKNPIPTSKKQATHTKTNDRTKTMSKLTEGVQYVALFTNAG